MLTKHMGKSAAMGVVTAAAASSMLLTAGMAVAQGQPSGAAETQGGDLSCAVTFSHDNAGGGTYTTRALVADCEGNLGQNWELCVSQSWLDACGDITRFNGQGAIEGRALIDNRNQGYLAEGEYFYINDKSLFG